MLDSRASLRAAVAQGYLITAEDDLSAAKEVLTEGRFAEARDLAIGATKAMLSALALVKGPEEEVAEASDQPDEYELAENQREAGGL